MLCGMRLRAGFSTEARPRRSGCVEGQAVIDRQGVRARTMALSVTRSFRITATRATFFGRPRWVQPVVKWPKGKASSDRGQSGHVEHASHRRSSTRVGSSTLHQAGFTIDWRDADANRGTGADGMSLSGLEERQRSRPEADAAGMPAGRHRGELSGLVWHDQTASPRNLYEIASLLPSPRPRPKGGRPPIQHRAALTGILFVLRSGLPREMLPADMGCGIGKRRASGSACITCCWSVCTRRVRSTGAELAWTALLSRPKRGLPPARTRRTAASRARNATSSATRAASRWAFA